MTTNTQLFEQAKTVIPGGVNSPVRAFGSVGGTPRFFVSGRGAWLRDVEANEYVDLIGSWGPAILGHAHPDVIAAVTEAAGRGLSFGAPGPGEVELAGRIVAAMPPVEQVRLVSSGTEATMSAIRLARGFTGRRLVVKFAGCYHGHVDALLAAAGSGAATFALPDSAGVTPSAASDTLVLPYGDVAALREAFAERGEDIACVITEAAPANMGVVPPPDGFNAALSHLCHDFGALFISDEVLTGFRVTAIGHYGLDGAVEGWRPDLMTFGKVIGGGLPVGAFGGRADVMALLAPEGPVYQAGTLSGNPVAMAAGNATMAALDDGVYARMNQAADVLREEVASALGGEGVPHRIQSVGPLFSVFFRDGEVATYDEARTQNTRAFAAFFHAMLDAHVVLPPSAFEAWFVSAAHDERALDAIVTALPAAARAAARFV